MNFAKILTIIFLILAWIYIPGGITPGAVFVSGAFATVMVFWKRK